ncbi:hypothetical protein CHUAL_013745 [Chamberlinius hualienensis]
MNEEELQCFYQLKLWLHTEIQLHTRTDEDFLLIFVRGSKANFEKAKKKLTAYYAIRKNYPKWWGNRSFEDNSTLSILQLNMSIALMDNSAFSTWPTIVITSFRNLPRQPLNVDDIFKLHTIIFDVIIRRQTAQLNGVIWFIDAKDTPYWFIAQLLNPILVRNIWNSFVIPLPVRLKGVYILNCPLIGYTIYAISKPFLSEKLKQRIRIYRTGWNELFQLIPENLVPDNNGGSAGPIEKHNEAFINEALAFNDYIEDDKKYGYFL